MERYVHDIYDVILKIIVIVYGVVFLRFIGIEEDIEKVLNIEFTTLTGDKLFLDYLCLLKNGTLCHIEFQFPKAKPDDYNRFFRYNIVAEARNQRTTDTTIFNFSNRKSTDKMRRMGKTKYFKPNQFFLGEIDFENYIQNIKIKVDSNDKLTNFEEIALMLLCLRQDFTGKFEALKKIRKLLKRKELFDESKFEFIEAVIKLEIENLLSDDEQKEIEGEIVMSYEAENIVAQALHEVSLKTLSEAKIEYRQIGFSEGLSKGRSEAIDELARELRDDVDIGLLAEKTGLTVSQIQNL